jgi:hypothetical protein
MASGGASSENNGKIALCTEQFAWVKWKYAVLIGSTTLDSKHRMSPEWNLAHLSESMAECLLVNQIYALF